MRLLSTDRVFHLLLDVPPEERKVEDQREPVSVDEEQEREESMDGNFGDDVGVEAVAEIDGVDVVADLSAQHRLASGTKRTIAQAVGQLAQVVRGEGEEGKRGLAYHSKSLYMMVKKTWRNRLTAFMSTAKRYNHASPDILAVLQIESWES